MVQIETRRTSVAGWGGVGWLVSISYEENLENFEIGIVVTPWCVVDEPRIVILIYEFEF